MNNEIIERLAKCESRISDLVESAEEMAPRMDKLNLIRERINSLKNAATLVRDEPEYMASDIQILDSRCGEVGGDAADAIRFCDEFIDGTCDLHQRRILSFCKREIRIISAIMQAQLAGYRDYIKK